MKRNSKKKLIALLCVFALGSANVKNSQAMFGGFDKSKIISNLISYPGDIKKYEEMWQKGIEKIYTELYECNQKLKGCTVEVINEDEFAKRTYTLDPPDKNFSIFRVGEIFRDSSRPGALIDSLFDNFVKAGIAVYSSDNGNSNNNSNNFFSFFQNQPPNDTTTLYQKIKSLSSDEAIVFNNVGKIFTVDNFIPTIPLKSVEEIKKSKVADPFFNKPLGLKPLFCLNEQAKRGGILSLFESFSETCPGFLVAIYNGTKNNFRTLIIRMLCSEEINDLKKKIAVEYLKDLSELNPKVGMKRLCSDTGINFLGRIRFKKSKFNKIRRFGISNLLSKFIGGTKTEDQNQDQDQDQNEKKSFYKVSEVAYQIWVENRGFIERACRKSVQNSVDLLDVALTPTILLGAYKSSNNFYSYLGRKILQGGEYTSEFLKSRNKLLSDPKKLKEAVSKMMQEGIVGLESTIESLTNLVMGRVAMSKMTDIFNKTHCQLITFIGPPGTGKSLLANKFSLALTGKPLPSWGYFTSSSVRPGVPVVDQFFDGNSELIKRLKACNGKTVLFFDEIDKYDSKELLEKFRDAIDSGTMEVTSKEKVLEVDTFSKNKSYERVRTEKINISGLIVIFGTNEKPECWGLPPDDPNDPAENIGRTVVKRDGSMVQRFLRFKFHSFKKPDYKKMYENAFKSIVKNSEKIFGFEIVCEDDLLDKLAEESCYRMQGGRSVAVILNEMAGAITSFDLKKDAEKYETGILAKVKRLVKKRKPKVQKVKVKFNNDTHKFEIEQIVDNADQLPPIKEIPEENEEDNENEKNQEIDNQGINNEVNSDIQDQHDDHKKDNQEMNNQEINNQEINNEVDDNVLNKQDSQQEANSEPIEHQKDESENQKIENDQEFDNKSISIDSASDQHESDQKGIDSYDSDYENDKKPINLEDDREEIIAD